MKRFVAFLATCSLAISNSERTKVKELEEKIKKSVEECKVQLDASDDDVAALIEYKPAANQKTKCLHACTMKQLGILDENNKLVEAEAIDFIKSIAAGNAEIEKRGMKIFNKCKNTPAISDG